MTLNLDNIDLGSFSAANPEGDTLGQINTSVDQQRSRQANATMSEAFKVNPDEYAHNVQLSRQSGIPTDLVSANPKAVETDLKLKQINFDQMSKRSPNTAAFLTDFNKAAIAHDDVGVLERIEHVFDGLGESINIGFDQQVLGLLAKGTVETADRRDLLIPAGALPAHVQDLAPVLSIEMAERMGIRSDEELVQVKEESINSLVNQIKDLQQRRQELTPDDLSTIEQGVRSGVESLANMAPGFALTLASGGRAFPLLATMGTQTYGSGFAEALANDLSPEDAHRYASIDAAIEVGTELLPASTLTRIIAGNVKGKVSKEALKFVVQEMGTEQLATLGQSLNAYVFDLDEQLAQAETAQEMIDIQLQRQAVTAIATIVAGGTQATIAGSINKAVGSLQKQSRHQETRTQAEQRALDELNDTASNSKLRTRDQESFAQFVRDSAGDQNTHVFIDAAQAALYLRDKDATNDPALQALADRVQQAATHGYEVAIPVEEFASTLAGTEHFEALRDSMTLSGESVAPFRQEQVRQETQDYMASLVAEAQENVSQYVESQEIFESVRDQLVDTGMVTPQNAGVMAQIVPAWATVFAQKHGITVQEAYQRSGLRIEGPQTGRAEELAAQEALTQAQAAGYEGDNPTEAREWQQAVEKFGAEGMTHEARMARAQQMGFHTDERFFHGTTEDFNEFIPTDLDVEDAANILPGGVDNEVGLFFARDPSDANFFAGVSENRLGNPTAEDGSNVIPVYLRWEGKNVIEYPDQETFLADIEENYGEAKDFREKMLANGVQAIRIKKPDVQLDGRDFAEWMIVLDPSNIRSVNAAFDPDFSDSADLLAQSAAPRYTEEDIQFLEDQQLVTPEEAQILRSQSQDSIDETPRPKQARQEPRTISGGEPRPQWAEETVVKTASGEPATVYRGSATGQTTPDNFQQLGAATGHPSAPLGVWFTSNVNDAAIYGQVSEHQLDLRNPKEYTTDTLPEFDSPEDAVALREQLQAEGHDGVVIDLRDAGGPVQFVAFDAEQVIEPATEVFEQSQPDPTETDAFREWAGTDEIVEPDEINDFDFSGDGPFVLRVFHGTTHSFDEFNASIRGTKEGQFGAVNYFTSSQYDAEQNYTTEGPDLTNRITQRAERIASEEDLDYDDPEVIERARSEIAGDGSHVLEVFVKTEKPFIVGQDSPFEEFIDLDRINDDAIALVAENNGIEEDEVRDNLEDYEDEIEDARWELQDETENPLISAIETVAARYEFETSELFEVVADSITEGIRHSELEAMLRGAEALAYAEDPNTGELAGYHALGEIIQELGFDSIILKDAEQRFENMDMESGTTHVHVFDANNTNIKSVDNQGTFDPTDPNIYRQAPQSNTVRGYYDPANAVIRLTEASDLSTFLHEFAHFMYEMELKAGGDTVQDIHSWFKRNAAEVAREANDYVGREGELEQDTRPYDTEIIFTATFDDGEVLTETIRGRDMGHALQRAENNYPGATISLLDQGDIGLADDWAEQLAESRKSEVAQRGTSGRFNQDDIPDFRKPAPVRVTEEDVVAYLDINSTGDQTKDKAIRRAVHEQFARGFETYLMEGKAPSVELRNAFRTFARWLTQIYRAVRGKLNVKLDDEMRQVFNRLLATEEQIKAAEARVRYKPMFTDAAMAGMTEEEFAKYQEQQKKVRDVASETLRDQLIGELTRQTKSWWKEEKADLVDEEINRLQDEQVYRARETLRGEQLKLDHATVKEMIGESVTDKRDRTYTRIPPALSGMTAKGAKGVHPDEAAAFFGYGSGDEMLRDLVEKPSIKEAAETAAEQRMRAIHGDILNDGSIEQQADEALQNEERGRLMLAELRALAKANNVPTLDRQTIKSLAEEAIAKLAYRNIHPGKYRKAEIRAAQEAATELQAGNKEAAARAKARQVMNFYLGAAANDARNNTLKIVERMARYNKKQVREEIQKAENGYWEQIVKILNRFEFRKSATLRQVDQVNQDINTWAAERINEDGDALILSPAVLNETYVTHWKNVPYGDLQGINDSVKNIEHVARYSNNMTRMGEEIQFKKLVQRWVDHMNAMPDRFQTFASVADKPSRPVTWGRWAMAQMTKIPWMASWLDGGERIGLSHKILVQPFTDAHAAEIKLWKDVGNKVLEAIETRDKTTLKRHNRKFFIPEIKGTNGHTGNLMGHEILAVALNTGNQGNLRKMLLGEGWANPDDDTTVSLSNPKLQAVLRNMTKDDWDLVQLIWDQMETLYPQLAEVHRRTTGLVPPKVDATPVETEFGTYRGGYYPVKYDADRDHRAEQNEEKLNAQTESMFGSIGSIQATVNASATNERTAYYAPIRLGLDVVPAHFQETIHYITHHDAVREVNKLIRNKEVANTIKAKIGPEEYAQLKPWLNDIAKDGREAPSKTYWESAMQRLRFGLTLGIMGFKASTGIIQISGLSNTTAEVGTGPLLQSMRSILGRPSTIRDAWDFASSNSKVLNHRAKTMDREIKNAMQRLDGKRGIMAAVQEASMKHIALTQTYMVDLPSWHAAYIKSMKEHGDEQKAYQYADWLVENVQGSGATKDLARIMRNQNEANRMFTMFMTFFSSLWNMERDLVKGARSGRYSPTTVAAKTMFLFTIPVMFEMLMRGELAPGEDEEPEQYGQRVLTQTALFPLQSVPFLRDIVNGTFGDYGYNMSPLGQLLESGTRTLPEVVERGFTDEEITKGQAKGATKFVGATAGVPGVNQAWATGEHLYDVLAEGEELTVHQLLFGPKKE